MSKYEYDEFEEFEGIEAYYDYLNGKKICDKDFILNEMCINKDKWYNGKEINEVEFAKIYSEISSLKHIDGNFYNINGYVSDTKLKNHIQIIISTVITSKVSTFVNSIYNYFVNIIDDYIPKEDKIHVQNGTIMIQNGEFSFSEEKEFTTNRLNVCYLETTKIPVKWLQYLNDLLIDNEITILQEYLGYCLIPTLRGQRALFIIGSGGEGKSVLGKVITNIFSNSISSDKIHGLFVGNFGLSNIKKKLIIFDDDLMGYKLKDTATFKTLVTGGKVTIEEKFKPKEEIEPYARFIALGNHMLQSLNDESDGFKRRLLILTTKDKPKDRENNPYLFDELIEEKDLILLWAMQGLSRLIKNGFKFSYDEEMKQKAEILISNDGTKIIEEFLTSDYVELGNNTFTCTKDIFIQYQKYCENNSYTPLNSDTFNKRLANISQQKGMQKSKVKIDDTGKETRGYKGISLKDIDY